MAPAIYQNTLHASGVSNKSARKRGMAATHLMRERPVGERRRAIGPVGTIARLATGGFLIAMAVSAATAGDLRIHEAAIGVVGLPSIVMATVLTVKRVLGTSAHLNATEPVGTATNLGIIVGLFVMPWTSEIAYFFYGIPMFLAAWRGYLGCEMMAISNFILRRLDEVGCPWFWPVDTLESRLAGRGRQKC